jgi:hypothetical protein
MKLEWGHLIHIYQMTWPKVPEVNRPLCRASSFIHRLNRRYHENDLFEHLIQAVLSSKAITYQELIAQN